MEQGKPLIIGTRGSALALKQSEIVRDKLMAIDSTLRVEIKVITTKGDTNSNPIPLDTVGKGWFTAELESELLAGTIHLAAHSLKDLPEQLPEGLMLGALTDREDPRDVLVSRGNVRLVDLPMGAVIGTDSLRRKVQILALRPDLVVESIRGNVPTRIAKLDAADSRYTAIVIAAAGLIRLGLESRISQYFELNEITPAPGQGTLAIELCANNMPLRALVARIGDADATLAAEAERAFSNAVGGGCKEPVGAHVRFDGDTCTLLAMAAFGTDGSTLQRNQISCTRTTVVEQARTLARSMLAETYAQK